ncbi:hypothetical protein COK36_27195 [Bacillus cereus]|nr:hypothetical protein [Bacillus cereus]PEX75848.1 hypothetical protein CN462_03940 [Bacillus cereus]PFL22602.1 hypothetical protein COJ22_16750 [Bacillus cereus]PFR56945.1 hypothetical protein COK36_27195 [Bacillus cereus]PGW94854.1 hypothetical protein COE19_12125 [Bacillus cereus]PGY98363.1 hypothetical protein COE38_02695 [Bacillus cereus]
MFMKFQKKGWYGGLFDPNGNEGSTGEGLSHFLAQQFEVLKGLHTGFDKFYPANNWMTSSRPNWVNKVAYEDATDMVKAGCVVVFLYYLKDQLGYSVKDIIFHGPISSGTLKEVFANLTGELVFGDRDDEPPFFTFKQFIDINFPGTTTIPTNISSPFPLPYRGWYQIGGPAREVFIAKDPAETDIYATNPTTGDIWEWNQNPGNDWTRRGGPGNMFATTLHQLFGLSVDKQGVYRYKGITDEWEQVGYPADAIFADFQNLYARNPVTGELWKFNGTPFNWTQIGGPGSMWAGTSDNLYGLSVDKQGVYRYKGTPNEWEQVGGPAGTIFTNYYNLFATNPTTGEIYMYNGTPFNWTRIGGPANMFATAYGGPSANDDPNMSSLFALSPDKQGVYRWSGYPDLWTKVGGPADAIFSGGSSICALSPETHNLMYSPVAYLF